MKLGRHKGIEVNCVWCGIQFIAVAKRVEVGMGKFCSIKCYGEWQKENKPSERVGKENAKVYPKTNGGYFVQWLQEDGTPKNSPWHKWAWEMNFGEIPDGYVVEYVDGNKNNIVIENLQLRMTRRKKHTLPKPKRSLSIEHKNKISLAVKRRWENGDFEFHRGESNPNWKPKKERHPKEFSRELKDFIRQRDGHLCQICGEDLVGGTRRGIVHHIDGNKQNNHADNLILFCASCHIKVHFTTGNTSPTIMAFRSKLT